jgi:hypothetical protein
MLNKISLRTGDKVTLFLILTVATLLVVTIYSLFSVFNPFSRTKATTVTITPYSKGAHWTIGRWYTSTGGYNMDGMYKDLDTMNSAGINWVRFAMHKGTGTGLYDKLVPALAARNMGWLANVMNPNGKTAGTETQRAEYKAWLAVMVNRYKASGVVKYYEIHNEANIHHFWNIDEYTTDTVAYASSVSDYIEHLKDGYTTVKANDPDAKVLIGGLSQWKDERFMDELIKQGGFQYFDIMAFHPYGSNPTKSMEELNSLKSKMALNATLAAKPIWVTEFGFSAVSGSVGYMGTGSTETTKAQYLTDAMQKFRAAGVNFPMMWYNYNGDNEGSSTTWVGYELVDTNRTTLVSTYREAYYAYKALWPNTSMTATATPTAAPITSIPTPSAVPVTSTATPTAPTTSATAVPSSDLTAPVITISSPTNGSTLPKAGNVKVNTSATDAAGVFEIRILVDGELLKSCQSATLCSDNWNVGKVSSGTHTITVTARDASSNSNLGSKSISVTK